MTQQREAMTQDTSTSGPAGGLDAPGGTPYPDIAGKIVRLVDYWDGRGFGAGLAASLRVPADSYPDDLGARAVTSRPGPVATAAAELSAAFAAGDAGRGGGYEWRRGRPRRGEHCRTETIRDVQVSPERSPVLASSRVAW